MKTVWVIEQGSYSDYHVVGVFTTRENAERVLAKIEARWDKATIAEWPLDPVVDALNAGLRIWYVQMLRDGSTERVEEREFDTYDVGGSVHVWERTKAPAYKDKGIPDVLCVTTWAKDAEHAIKITNEHRAQMIAAGTFK